MNAYVKMQNITSPIYVEEVRIIKILNSRTGKETELTDFTSFRFYGSYSYTFVGKSILNAWGQNIEYVLFG